MLHKKEKAQGLVEFALILPLLLLLLLGIIEGARIIWAYITVQTAAREAARYAIAGRPYLYADYNGGVAAQYPICIGDVISSGGKIVAEPEPYVTGAQPWLCSPPNRVEAVKKMAIQRGQTVAISEVCTDPNQFFRKNPPDPVNNCADRAGTFGVLVRGQVTTETTGISTTTIITLVTNHPGTQGLNVEISTFYNVKMLDPIFDTLMGGNFFRMEGRSVLQNEGIDAAAGINPPPPVETPNPGSNTDTGGGSGTGKLIYAENYTVEQNDNLIVNLQNHPAVEGPYDIYLDGPGGKYPVCTNVSTDNAGTIRVPCPLSTFPVPAGVYTLYSTKTGITSPALATAPSQVTVTGANTPDILVEGGYIWAANSKTKLTLLAHQPADAPYTLELHDASGGLVQTIVASTTATSNLAWDVPDVKALGHPACDKRSKTPCTIRSFSSSGTPLAQKEVYVNQPEIILAAGKIAYAQGETVLIYLRGHTPNKIYTVDILGGSPNPFTLGQIAYPTNSEGDSTLPIYWTIPLNCGAKIGWANGFYDLVSRTAGQSDQIALLPNFQIDTPTIPYLTIDGGYTWPAGSFININLLGHNPNTSHYLMFGTKRVPTADPADNDTFNTGGCGTATMEYTIPITTAQGVYKLESFLAAGNVSQATRNVQVNKTPYILVLEGKKVLPNTTITVQLGSHAPNTGYKVIFDGYALFEVQADGNGFAEKTYDLNSLPAALRSPGTFGIARDLHSESNLKAGVAVATTTLTLLGADLQLTKVEFPTNVSTYSLNSTVPITLTIKNLQPVSITSYFDNDFYFNPGPLPPSYQTGRNFPGNAKYWRNFVAPAGQTGDTFILTDTFTLQKYGPQKVYGFADTGNAVYEAESTGQIANPNNLNSGVFTVTCQAPPLTDGFDTDISGPPIPNWTFQRYNNANQGYGAQISGQQLYLNSDGGGNFNSSDDTGGGYVYLYRTTPVTATAGLDVIVQVLGAPTNTSYASAGIEIRNSADPASPKVSLGVAWYTPGTDRYILMPSYRDGGGTSWVGSVNDYNNTHTFSTISTSNPVWLRLERVPGTKTFNFYYKQQVAKPTNWGAAVTSVTMVNVSDQMQVGLFMTPYVNGTTGTGRFDNFSFAPAPGSCQDNPVPPPAIPPGLEICTPVLQNRSFEEGKLPWEYTSFDGVTRSAGSANTGIFKLFAPTFSGTDFNPYFYQKFTMPSWVISTTTQFNLSLYVNIDNLGNNQSADQFYAVVATSPSTATSITTPKPVAQGDMPGSAYDSTKWTPINLVLPIINPANIENYANQPLYLYLYNNSNSSGACGGVGNCTTKFFFDDVNLTSCTKEPLPQTINTRIEGKLTLHYGDGSTGKLGYVKVWAYAEGNNTVYETFTLPNGDFNFYNLPATSAGTKYFLFSQHYLIEGGVQIQTLMDDTTVQLRAANNNNSPAKAFLDLYTLPAFTSTP